MAPMPRPLPRKKRTSKARAKEGSRARSARRRAVRREAARANKDRRAQVRMDYLQGISNSSRRRSARAKIMPVFRAAEAAEASRARRRSESRRRRARPSRTTVSMGGLFDLPATVPQRAPASKRATRRAKTPTRRRKPSKSSSPRIIPAHVMHGKEAEGMGPSPVRLTAAQKARQQASFDEAVRHGEIIPADVEQNKGERYRKYLDRLQRQMKHAGPTIDVDHGDLVLPVADEHAQRALQSRRGRVRLRPGTLAIPAVSSKMGGPTYLERHTGTGRPVGRVPNADRRTRKKEPGGYVRMWNERPGDLGN